jgi:hypothetical protein
LVEEVSFYNLDDFQQLVIHLPLMECSWLLQSNYTVHIFASSLFSIFDCR